jgi:hypothetical protein
MGCRYRIRKVGKIKSANSLVDQIYNKAISSNNEEQMIRCFFYNSKYIQTLEEEAKLRFKKSKKPNKNRFRAVKKAILNSVYAKCLNDYYLKNNSKIYSRSTRQLRN